MFHITIPQSPYLLVAEIFCAQGLPYTFPLLFSKVAIKCSYYIAFIIARHVWPYFALIS